jgi:(1->4)-alpha-D-glucan 1-alpha-D-glucosylmutase
LAVLSEIPESWSESWVDWRRRTAEFSTTIGDEEAPDANDQYMILQAVLAAWPLELLSEQADETVVDSFRERLEAFVIKALREAKRHTSWVNNNESYESAALAFLRSTISSSNGCLVSLRPVAQRLAFLGMVYSLSRSVLKCTIPGVPDFYQGTEFWDLSFVDPDNRRPVDYVERSHSLDHSAPLASFLSSWPDGRIKQRVIHRLLADRQAAPSLYAFGDYQPLRPRGERRRQVVAFARSCGTDRLVVLAPRLLADMTTENAVPVGTAWADTTVPVPAGTWRDIFTGRQFTVADEELCPVSELFAELPISVLRAQP